MQDFTTSMNPPDHIWVLASKSLTGNVSPEEQEQLDNFTRLHPEFYYTLQILSRFWKASKDEDDDNEYELPRLKTEADERQSKSISNKIRAVWMAFRNFFR